MKCVQSLILCALAILKRPRRPDALANIILLSLCHTLNYEAILQPANSLDWNSNLKTIFNENNIMTFGERAGLIIIH